MDSPTTRHHLACFVKLPPLGLSFTTINIAELAARGDTQFGLLSPADYHHGLPAANRKGIADRDDQAGEPLVVLGSQHGNNATVRRVCTSAQPPQGHGHTLGDVSQIPHAPPREQQIMTRTTVVSDGLVDRA